MPSDSAVGEVAEGGAWAVRVEEGRGGQWVGDSWEWNARTMISEVLDTATSCYRRGSIKHMAHQEAVFRQQIAGRGLAWCL
jgi:hypothetical protein